MFLREAEEKIRQGLLSMGSNVPEMTAGRQRDDMVSQESQSSYASAVEPPTVQRVPQELVLLRAANNPGIQDPQSVVPVVNEPFVPKPPPRPPPPSPPRQLVYGCGYGICDTTSFPYLATFSSFCCRSHGKLRWIRRKPIRNFKDL